MSTRRLTTAVTALLLFMGVISSQAMAASGMELAIQDDGVFLGEDRMSREQALDTVKAMGVSRIRANVVWAYVLDGSQAKAKKAPRNPQYHFQGYDALVDSAARRGIKVQLTLTGPTPAFATASKKIGNNKPNAKMYARFVTDWTRHFRGRVDRYAMWNEPNWKTRIQPRAQAPKLYRALYVAGYNAVKRTDQRAQVLLGEFAPGDRASASIAPLKFLRQMLCVDGKYRKLRGKARCAGLKADGVAHHPYAFTKAPTYQHPNRDVVTIGTLSRMTGALAKLRRSGALRTPTGKTPPLLLTEFGYFAQGDRMIEESVRAEYMTDSLQMALMAPGVTQMLQYMLVSMPAGSTHWDTGLLGSGGVPTLTSEAFRQWGSSRQSAGQIRTVR